MVAGAASDGSWSVLCQARKDSDGDGRISVRISDQGALLGDALGTYLVLGTGAGFEIDELAAGSGDGRWLVVKREGALHLIDASARTDVDLSASGADPRSDSATFRDHRAVAFDPGSTRLAYLRGVAGRTLIVVRELGSGSERVLDPGAGEVWRLEFDATGHWLELSVVATDSNRNGRLDWPVPPVSVNSWRCQGPLSRMAVWPDHGDRTEQRFALIEDGSVSSLPGTLAPCGKALLRRTEQEELVLQTGDQLSVLEPARCKARLLHADCSRNALIVACTGTKARRPPLELVGTSYRLPLGVDIAPLGRDQFSMTRAGSRFVPISSGQNPVVVDLEARRVIPLKAGDVTIAGAGDHVLLRRGERLVLWNVAAQTESLLPGELWPFGEVLETRGTVLVEPLIVDVTNARLLGTVAGRAAALDVGGRVLLAETPSVSGAALAVGPLTWTAPVPAPGPATSAL